MLSTVLVYKQLGETPLEALERFRVLYPEYKETKLSYIGRLDPLAEGEMLVLIGEENKNREKYLHLNKEYEFEILFGFSTDTYDLLGLVTENNSENQNIKITEVKEFELKLRQALECFVGKHSQKYPPYSSKTVSGKPLFEYAKEGKLSEIEIPTKEIEIFEIEYLGMREISQDELQTQILEKIALVKGDFRQAEIADCWTSDFEKINKNNLYLKSTDTNFLIAKAKIHASSGTYVRSLVHELGKKLRIPATAFSIKRISYK